METKPGPRSSYALGLQKNCYTGAMVPVTDYHRAPWCPMFCRKHAAQRMPTSQAMREAKARPPPSGSQPTPACQYQHANMRMENTDETLNICDTTTMRGHRAARYQVSNVRGPKSPHLRRRQKPKWKRNGCCSANCPPYPPVICCPLACHIQGGFTFLPNPTPRCRHTVDYTRVLAV